MPSSSSSCLAARRAHSADNVEQAKQATAEAQKAQSELQKAQGRG